MKLVIYVKPSRLLKSTHQALAGGKYVTYTEASQDKVQVQANRPGLSESHRTTKLLLGRSSGSVEQKTSSVKKVNNKLFSPAEKTVIDKLAAIEHDRWSGQAKTAIYEMTDDRRSRWAKLAKTPYNKLTEEMKEKDREQVYIYWPVIREYIDSLMAPKLRKGYTDIWVVPRAPGMTVENAKAKTFKVDSKLKVFDEDDDSNENNIELKIIRKNRGRAVNRQINASRVAVDPTYVPEQMV